MDLNLQPCLNKVIFNDPSYRIEFDDQDYMNEQMKHELRYTVLNPNTFPNGSPYLLKKPVPHPFIVHFNFFPGKLKRKAMSDVGFWYHGGAVGEAQSLSADDPIENHLQRLIAEFGGG